MRQGENLSPALISIYLNNLQDYLEHTGVTGLVSISSDLETELMVCLKIILFLYADDTILIAESSSDLQKSLNNFSIYCTQWKLDINVEKTKF